MVERRDGVCEVRRHTISRNQITTSRLRKVRLRIVKRHQKAGNAIREKALPVGKGKKKPRVRERRLVRSELSISVRSP